MPRHQPIAIIGAGLGGLTLARVLHTAGIPAAVYDRDASPRARPQGCVIDLHEDTGQAALRAAGLHTAFRALARTGTGSVRILDRNAAVCREEDPAPDTVRADIARGRLRDLLLGSLPGTRSAGERASRRRGRWATAGTRYGSATVRGSPPTCSSEPTAPGPESVRSYRRSGPATRA